MKKKLLAFSLPTGLLLEVIYMVVNRFLFPVSDHVGYPIMIVSILLMLVGIAYHGYCFGNIAVPGIFESQHIQI